MDGVTLSSPLAGAAPLPAGEASLGMPAQALSGQATQMYVVDDFGYPSINLNRGDTFADVSHGELVGTVYESISGQSYTPIAIADGYAGPDLDGAILDLATTVRDNNPDGDYSGVAVNISYYGESPGQRATDALAGLIGGGATVYVASGNDPTQPPNPLSALPGVVTVGGDQGLVGEPATGQRVDAFPANPEIDVTANSVVRATPIANADGSFAGVDINQDGSVDLPADRFANPQRDATVAQFAGRNPAESAVSYAAMTAHFNALAADPNADASAMDGKVIALSELIDNNDLAGLEPPPGIDASRVYISVEDAGGTPETVIFLGLDADGRLTGLSDLGQGVAVRGTSYAAPSAAAGLSDGAVPVDRN